MGEILPSLSPETWCVAVFILRDPLDLEMADILWVELWMNV